MSSPAAIAPSPAPLVARGIRKSFGGVEVLHGVDFDARAGSVVALLGENGAGKSTLVRILAGDHDPDDGRIVVAGVEHERLEPAQALDAGIRMIYQELSDAGALSVAENICLGSWPTRHGLIDWPALRRRARDLLDELGMELDVDRPVSSLGLGERQMVEIARAIGGRARCLILDEPTAALSGAEVEKLFAIVRRLQERGVALIHITHRLDEVRQIADRVVVMRDGSVVLDEAVADVGHQQMVSAMIGRDVEALGRPAPVPPPADEPLLRFAGASCAGAFEDVDLDVRPGEVVALYGKLGSGAAEAAEAAFGVRALTAGTLEVGGRARRFGSPYEAIEAGVGMLPADRRAAGTFPVLSVATNLAITSWRRLARFGAVVTRRTEAATYMRWHEELHVRSRGEPAQPMGTLSGGNQQKVLLGRWLERGTRVLVLIEPTRGVDVGARAEIYRTIRSLVADGLAVLVSSSDHEEVFQIADRVAVFARGRVVAELVDDTITIQRLADATSGGTDHEQ